MQNLLSWYTDLGAAITEARRTKRPILSLRLLGRLDQAQSCANSRFFRRMLYPEPRIHRMLRERFVLHWQSVRAVPIVTIDFGNGKRLQKPITGNSVHLVLDENGVPVDALPGLVSAEVFVRQLETAMQLARLDPRRRCEEHARLATVPNKPAQPSRAVAASQIAMTKHVVEAPLLRAIEPPSVERDTAINLGLHTQIHAQLARGVWSIEALVDYIYRYLFLMPPDDPMLGLDVPDPV
ncbi:MAG: hypothetical protein QM831_24890 [Kofleriaceae bacterium]